MGILYLVATPIGNLEDISLRALRVLKEVKLIAAEDTRKTRILLSRYKIKTPMVSYHEYSGRNKLDHLMEFLDKNDVAVVSEAGMPGISDPGFELVRAAIEKSVEVAPVPGASAVLSALSVSGLPASPFLFAGFLPGKKKDRLNFLNKIKNCGYTTVLFEAPHRLLATLGELDGAIGDRRIAVCREMTKRYEEIFRGTIGEAKKHFTSPRGEFVLVIEGKSGEIPPDKEETLQAALKELAGLKEQGFSLREAIATVSQRSGMSRNELYREWLKLGHN